MHSIDFNRVPSFYHKYLEKVNEETIQQALETQQDELNTFLATIPEEKWMHRYAPNKWTIKELVLHISDAERIFCYRALCFSRGEKGSLPGFEEDDYVLASEANARSEADILQELKTVQAATNSLFNSFSEEQLNSEGIANSNSIYVKAIGFIIAGHARHHMEILKE